MRSYTPVLTLWAPHHRNRCLALLGWLVDVPRNNFEIRRADGPMHCPRSARESCSSPFRFRCSDVRQVHSLLWASASSCGRRKQRLSLRLVRLQGSYSWGIMNNTTAYLCLQRSRLSPSWNPVKDVPCSVVLPRLTLTHNRPLFLMLSPQPCLGVFCIFHLDLHHCIFFFLEILTNWFLTYKIWECPREAAQLKQMKMESGDSRGKVKINDA